MKRTSSLSTIGKVANYYDYDSLYNSGLKRTNTKVGRSNIWVKPDEQKFDDKHTLKNAQHLIIVAGHSVIISGHIEDADINEKDWYLLDYQKGRGLPQAIVGHIREGIRLASEPTSDTDAEQSLLVFSGGETRPTTGPINEGSSYFHVADAMNLWDGHSTMSSTVRSRTVAEEFATDSFQNLLFSICRFKEVTGHYPRKISVVSYTFKKQRFEELHAAAIRWPSDQFTYAGVDPDPSTGFDLQSSIEGEKISAAIPFQSDPYGCHTEVLQKKRNDRNPFSRTAPYELSCPEMKELLHWCGPEIIPSSKVPW